MYKHLQERYAPRPPVNIATLVKMKSDGEKIACITAYDASFATLVDDAGIDVVLVGDSLGMVIQGHDTTVHRAGDTGRRYLSLPRCGTWLVPAIPDG
jgi:3-methyl-2-oxobutanoate hydroxymethyltransferase